MSLNQFQPTGYTVILQVVIIHTFSKAAMSVNMQILVLHTSDNAFIWIKNLPFKNVKGISNISKHLKEIGHMTWNTTGKN